jgi:hypothetical protein
VAIEGKVVVVTVNSPAVKDGSYETAGNSRLVERSKRLSEKSDFKGIQK